MIVGDRTCDGTVRTNLLPMRMKVPLSSVELNTRLVHEFENTIA